MFNKEIKKICNMVRDLNERTDRYLDDVSNTIPDLTILWNGHSINITMETPETNTETVEYLKNLVNAYRDMEKDLI